MKHLGDITKINGNQIEPVDVITFGSPCQDLSVAGKRAGLAGERSGLFIEAVQIIKEMRESTDGECPTFAIWENVPGAFSSSKGEDFRAVLEELIRIKEPDTVIPEPPNGKWNTSGCIMGNGWSLAWRILDAQFWGVAQRRRRISLVMDLRGKSAPKILFVRKGMSRDTTESEKARKRIAGDIKSGVRNASTLVFNEAQITSPKNGNNPHWNDPCHTLSATDNRAPAVIYEDCAVPAIAFDGYNHSHAVRVRYRVRRLTPLECERLQGYPDYWTLLPAIVDMPDVTYDFWCKVLFEQSVREQEARLNEESGIYQVWRAVEPKTDEDLDDSPSSVHWENTGKPYAHKTKKQMIAWYNSMISSDSHRYQGLGNSIALPPHKWVMKRIAAQFERDATLGSLFDGIGGFPLIWEQLNGRGSAKWASEIESFPIAVTKYRFKEDCLNEWNFH